MNICLRYFNFISKKLFVNDQQKLSDKSLLNWLNVQNNNQSKSDHGQSEIFCKYKLMTMTIDSIDCNTICRCDILIDWYCESDVLW